MDLDNIHKIPLWLHSQGLDRIVVERFNLLSRKQDIQGILNLLRT